MSSSTYTFKHDFVELPGGTVVNLALVHDFYQSFLPERGTIIIIDGESYADPGGIIYQYWCRMKADRKFVYGETKERIKAAREKERVKIEALKRE